MTDPLLELRSLDLRSALADDGEGLRLQVVDGFLGIPSMRGEDVVIPARAGRDPGDRIADVLTIELSGFVAARTAAAWRIHTDALLAVLDENGVDAGQLIARAPYLGLATGSVAAISVRVKNAIPGPILAGGRFQRWSIELESVDPYWVVTPAGP